MYDRYRIVTGNDVRDAVAKLNTAKAKVSANVPVFDEGPLRVSTRKESGQGVNRTLDTRIFSPLLYRLSYLPVPEGGLERRFSYQAGARRARVPAVESHICCSAQTRYR